MIISSSDINLSSEHSRITKTKKEISNKVIDLNQPVSPQTTASGNNKLLESLQKMEKTKKEKTFKIELSEEDKQKLILIREFMKNLSGKNPGFYLLSDEIENEPETEKTETLSAKFKNLKLSVTAEELKASISSGTTSVKAVETTITEKHTDSEKLSFSADGIVKTADGREISVSIGMTMSRKTIYESFTKLINGKPVDPLVISYDGNLPDLTDKKYEFDLDLDGETEQISVPEEGSGFLALDKNSDGVINNGNELFGPSTGSGFAELARYDSDGNGWIDESDSVFYKLKIWSRTGSGESQLFSLAEKGVGAIYLGYADTPFIMTDLSGTESGQLAKSGIFLRENGTVGTIHHIDIIA